MFIATYAKAKGMKVIVLTCLSMSKLTPSQHPSGKRLFEVGDYVLDNGGVPGDAIVEVTKGLNAGPTSTFIGCSVLNWLMLAVIDWVRASGKPLPILQSQNLPGAIEANRELGRRYALRRRLQPSTRLTPWRTGSESTAEEQKQNSWWSINRGRSSLGNARPAAIRTSPEKKTRARSCSMAWRAPRRSRRGQST